MALPRIIVKRWPGAGVDVLVSSQPMRRCHDASYQCVVFDDAKLICIQLVECAGHSGR